MLTKQTGVNEAIYVSSGSETSDESNVSNAHIDFKEDTYIQNFSAKHTYHICRQPLHHEAPEGCLQT